MVKGTSLLTRVGLASSSSFDGDNGSSKKPNATPKSEKRPWLGVASRASSPPRPHRRSPASSSHPTWSSPFARRARPRRSRAAHPAHSPPPLLAPLRSPTPLLAPLIPAGPHLRTDPAASKREEPALWPHTGTTPSPHRGPRNRAPSSPGGLQNTNMRDPFDAPVDFINAVTDHKAGNEFTRTKAPLSGRESGLQNGDAKPFTPNPDALVRHQLQGASQHKDLTAEDPSTRFMDPETKELYFRSRSQEDEILLLRKQIAEASLKELRLLSEKHILERKLTDMRMAVNERQEEALSSAMRQLSQKKSHLEENMRLANELKVEEEELYFFTASLLSMLAEYDIRPPQINASTITIGTKRLYQKIHWKIRSLNDSLGDMTQSRNIYNTNHQQATPLRNESSPSYNVDPKRNTLHQHLQDPSDRNAEQMYRGSPFQPDILGAASSNYFKENAGPGDTQLYTHDNQNYPADGDPLPGIEGFQIVGDPRPGSTLTACGFPTNGTTLCNFQWVRYLEDGTRQSIEGATMYDYVVTADDVGTLLAVDCTPMDDNGRQGDLVREFANNENKIACDPEMQNAIDVYISNGKADFDAFVLQAYSPEEWELATLALRRPGYQVKSNHTGEVLIDEKYSLSLQTKIPNGRTTQFVLVSSGGVNLPFNTQGITDPNNEDSDVRLRDLIVLVMRTFQRKALDAKRKSKV